MDILESVNSCYQGDGKKDMTYLIYLFFKKISKITEQFLFLVELYSEEFQETLSTKQGLFPAKNDILSSLAVGGRWITTQSNLQVCAVVYISLLSSIIVLFLANIYVFEVNNRNTRKGCEICSKLTGKLVLLLLTLNVFTPFSSVSIVDFEQANVSWIIHIPSRHLPAQS